MSSSQDVTNLTRERKENSPISIQLLKPGSSKFYASRFGKRHVQVLFYGIFNYMSTAINACIPICLVAMADSTTTNNKNIATYELMHKGTIFSVFIWGNMTTQIFSGWLASHYGGKWILVITNGICSILVLLLPTVIHTFGFNGFVTGRFFQGILVGFTSSSVHSLLAKWAPPQERSSLAIIAGSGLPAGIVITTFTSGYIAASWYGWPMVFYALGTSQLLSSLLFAYYGYDSPADHPTISEQEVLYIDSCSAVSRNNQVQSIPWFRILTSTSFMALVLVQCSYMIGMHLLKLETPIYFSKVMELDIKSNSTLSSLPFLAKWFLGYLFSFMSDWLIAKRILTMDMSRKMLITIGFFVVCIALLVLAHCDKNDITIATILIVIGVGFLGAVMAGFMVNHIDLSPNHAGTLMGIGNQLAMMCSGIALMVVQYVVTDETNPSQWMIVFYSTAAVFVSTTIVFNIFGSAKVQTWNDNTENTPI